MLGSGNRKAIEKADVFMQKGEDEVSERSWAESRKKVEKALRLGSQQHVGDDL